MDRFATLNAFVVVFETGGFAAAARRLGTSRSQVNRAVMALEDHLGTTLLQRTTRSVAPTAAGEAFYLRANALLADLRDAEEAIRNEGREPVGDIRINAPMSFGIRRLGKVLARFIEAHPTIRIQLTLTDSFLDPVTEGFDLTIRIHEPAEPLAFIEHILAPAPRALLAAPAFLARHGEPRSVRDLVSLPCLHYGGLTTGATWRLHGPQGWRSINVNGVFCSNNADVLCDLAIAGSGVALLPEFIADGAIAAGQLVRVLPDHEPAALSLCLVYTPSRYLSRRLRLLIEFLQGAFPERV
jgi:DNA-binding transcriptional LysR family regulator